MNTPTLAADTQTGMPAAKEVQASFSMVNMTYVSIPLGSIRIGHTIARADGSTQPVSADEFRVTQPVRDADGDWIADEIDGSLRATLNGSDALRPPKLRTIPIRFLSNDPSLAVRARYEAFDVMGRSICSSSGDGVAQRDTGGSSRTKVDCRGCDRCDFAQAEGNSCALFGRIAVQIEGQKSLLGHYVLRTGSINTLRTIETNLRAFHALFGGRLRGVPFALKLRPMQTMQSLWQTFFVVDLEVNAASLAEAVALATVQADEDKRLGLDFDRMTSTFLAGIANGNVADDVAHADGVDLAEFYPASDFRRTFASLDAQGLAQSASQASGATTAAVVTTRGSTAQTMSSAGQATAPESGKLVGALVPGFDLPDGKGTVEQIIVREAPASSKDVTSMTDF